MSHVTRMNESYHTFNSVTLHIRINHGSRRRRLQSHKWMSRVTSTSHVTHVNESCHTNKSCYTCEWVMSHAQVVIHVWMSHVTPISHVTRVCVCVTHRMCVCVSHIVYATYGASHTSCVSHIVYVKCCVCHILCMSHIVTYNLWLVYVCDMSHSYDIHYIWHGMTRLRVRHVSFIVWVKDIYVYIKLGNTQCLHHVSTSCLCLHQIRQYTNK